MPCCTARQGGCILIKLKLRVKRLELLRLYHEFLRFTWLPISAYSFDCGTAQLLATQVSCVSAPESSSLGKKKKLLKKLRKSGPKKNIIMALIIAKVIIAVILCVVDNSSNESVADEKEFLYLLLKLSLTTGLRTLLNLLFYLLLYF